MSARLRGATVPALSILLFVALATHGARWMAVTFDEPAHLTAGYMALRYGDFRAGPNHPPLIRMLAALPAALDPGVRFPTGDESYRLGRQHSITGKFLLELNDYGPILFRGRLVIIALAAVLGLALHRWALSLFGPVAATATLALFALEPNLMANGSLVTTDLGLTLFFALTGWLLMRVCCRLSVPHLVGLAAVFALAQVSKFSAVILFPAAGVVLVWRALGRCPWERGRGRPPLRGRARKAAAAVGVLLVLAAAAWGSVWGVYRFRQAMAPQPGLAYDTTEDRELAASEAVFGERLRAIRVLPEAYVRGMAQLATWPQRRFYFAGRVRERALWYFYPAVLLLKTPTALLLLAALALVLAVRDPRRLPEGWPALAVLPLALLLAGMSSGVNTGVRHLLPVYPFLLLAAGAAASWLAARRRGRIALAALAVVAIAEFAHVYPDTLAFFSTLAGGPEHGDRWLVETDMDWGQGLKALGVWTRERAIAQINLACNNPFPIDSLGFRARRLPDYGRGDPSALVKDALPGYIALSATVQSGIGFEDSSARDFYAPLRDMTPVAVIGKSIRVYWVERPWWNGADASAPRSGR